MTITSLFKISPLLTFASAMLLAAFSLRPLAAQELHLPFPIHSSAVESAPFDSYKLPIGPWADGDFAHEVVEGLIDRRAWQLDAPRASLIELMAPLRDQLRAQGYEPIYDCAARDCGGFDFRFATEVMAEPAMYVDLSNYRFFSARRGRDVISLMVSRSAGIGYVQMIHVSSKALPSLLTDQKLAPIAPIPLPPEGKLLTKLEAGLSAPIEGLIFSSNSPNLEGTSDDLLTLANWLKADENRKVVLIGHSDISGTVAGNIKVSQQRAEAVRQRLIKEHGIAPARLSAEGVGPLAPRASHADPAQAQLNRRVEVLALP